MIWVFVISVSKETVSMSYVKCCTHIVRILINCARSVACNIKNRSVDAV